MIGVQQYSHLHLVKLEDLPQSLRERIFSRYGIPQTDNPTVGRTLRENCLSSNLSATDYVRRTGLLEEKDHSLGTGHRLLNGTLSPMTEIGRKNGNGQDRKRHLEKAYATYLEYHRITKTRFLSRSQFYARLRQLSEHYERSDDTYRLFLRSDM